MVKLSGLTYLSKADLMKVISHAGDFMKETNLSLISSCVAYSRSRAPGNPLPKIVERDEDTIVSSQIGVSSGYNGFLARQNFL
jgi:hypothetical protein